MCVCLCECEHMIWHMHITCPGPSHFPSDQSVLELDVYPRLDKLERLVSELKQQQRAAELRNEAARVVALERHHQIMSALQSRGSGGGIGPPGAGSGTTPDALAMTSSGEQKMMIMMLQGIVSSMNRYTWSSASFFLLCASCRLHLRFSSRDQCVFSTGKKT